MAARSTASRRKCCRQRACRLRPNKARTATSRQHVESHIAMSFQKNPDGSARSRDADVTQNRNGAPRQTFSSVNEECNKQRRVIMKKLALGVATAAVLLSAAPAMAQVGVYAGRGGVGVELGAPGYYDYGD